MNNILIIGGSGYLGKEIIRISKTRFQTYYTYFSNSNYTDNAFYLNLNQPYTLKEILKNKNIDCIIFSARHEDSSSFNEFIDIIKKEKIRFIFTSSDAVFDGDKGNYNETDITNPLTEYGQAKLNFENIIKENLENYVIIRPGHILGKDCKRSKNIIKKLENKNNIKRFTDFYRTPIHVTDLAEIILELTTLSFTGIIHVGTNKNITPYQFAKIIADKIKISQSLISKSSCRTINPKLAKNTTLDTSLMKKIIKITPKNIERIDFV